MAESDSFTAIPGIDSDCKGWRYSMILIILILVFLFFWALFHGGTRHNDYFDNI